jgi:hypothetical protein
MRKSTGTLPQSRGIGDSWRLVGAAGTHNPALCLDFQFRLFALHARRCDMDDRLVHDFDGAAGAVAGLCADGFQYRDHRRT